MSEAAGVLVPLLKKESQAELTTQDFLTLVRWLLPGFLIDV